MSSKEHKKYIKEIKVYTSTLLKSESATKAFFQSIGILTKSGNLTSAYSNPISNNKK